MLDGKIVRDGGGRPVAGQWRPIVSDTLWLEVQRRLNDPARKSNRNGTDRKHLGSGLYRCGVCGQRVKAHGTRYRCAGHVMRSRSQVDSYVLNVVHERLSRPDLANLLPTTDESEAAQLHEEIERQRGRILRARAENSAETPLRPAAHAACMAHVSCPFGVISAVAGLNTGSPPSTRQVSGLGIHISPVRESRLSPLRRSCGPHPARAA
jgi:hypothetical protein